ncbi:MAG: uncharacterized protein JWP33_299, partial [Blastococcus sp.]|nr:uncharacterized protein [Blastococcus sp.]
MISGAARLAVIITFAAAAVALPPSTAQACIRLVCPDLDDGAATITYEGAGVSAVAGAEASDAPNFAWRLYDRCLAAAESTGYCSPTDVRECPPAEPGRVVGYFVVERRPIVREDLMYANPRNEPPPLLRAPSGSAPGNPVGDWLLYSEGCFDITALNPPPSPAEVFSYFQRLPLPTLATQHQPPGDGLSGLPVIFYTDSPSTQTFTVDIRGFTVVIEA